MSRRFPPSVTGVVAALLVLGGLAAAVAYYALVPTDDKTWRFVKQVLLESEYGDREGVIVRWTRPVTIATLNAREDDLHILRGLADDLNGLLKDTGISIGLGEFTTSDISVTFAPLRDFQRIANRMGFEYVEENSDLAGVTTMNGTSTSGRSS